jgi:hypothetical protein
MQTRNAIIQPEREEKRNAGLQELYVIALLRWWYEWSRYVSIRDGHQHVCGAVQLAVSAFCCRGRRRYSNEQIGELMVSKDSDEEMKPIQFSLPERDLILDLCSLDGDMEKRFRLATLSSKSITVPMNAYDLDELHGAVAAVANHEKDRKLRRKLDAICRRIETILDEEFPREAD